jgi:transposase
LPAHLPRIEKIIACTPEQCICSQCGKDKDLIGYETSEQLDIERAKHFVLVTKREKRACRRNRTQKLAARRQRASRSAGGRHPLGGRDLSTAQHSDSPVPQ